MTAIFSAIFLVLLCELIHITIHMYFCWFFCFFRCFGPLRCRCYLRCLYHLWLFRPYRVLCCLWLFRPYRLCGSWCRFCRSRCHICLWNYRSSRLIFRKSRRFCRSDHWRFHLRFAMICCHLTIPDTADHCQNANHDSKGGHPLLCLRRLSICSN